MMSFRRPLLYSSLLVVGLAILTFFACGEDDNPIDAGTDCSETCPVGASKTSAQEAMGSCGADGSFNPTTTEISAGGQCFGEGKCQVVCLYPECAAEQTLVITASEYRCEAADETSCEGVVCSDHGYCRIVNGAAECVCDDGYVAEGLACLPEEGFSCTDYCAMDQTCYGNEHYNSAASCKADCQASFSQEQLNCAEYTVCTAFGDCIEDYLSGDDDDDNLVETTLILDDGEANGGFRTISYPSRFVQAFTPPAYPATLVRVSFYIDRWDGIERETVLVVFYATTKGEPVGEPIYESAPFAFTSGEAWNEIDLSAVSELDAPVASGEFWIGLQAVDGLDTGPYLGLDNDAVAGGIWTWDGNLWTALPESSVLMIRPTVRYPAP